MGTDYQSGQYQVLIVLVLMDPCTGRLRRRDGPR